MSHTISPLDGRYASRLKALNGCFSEFALMRERCHVELMYALELESAGVFPELTDAEKARIETALGSFTEADFKRIKEIEKTTNHDVKAVEFFLRERLQLANPNRIHFGLTSEDVNNLAFTLGFKKYCELQVTHWRELLTALVSKVQAWANVPFPARTHGQHASPTTAGKEFAVFLARGLRLLEKLEQFRFTGKLNGATGNFSAMKSACPDQDWIAFMRYFVRTLGLEPNAFTTQIEPHDNWSEWFNLTRSFNNVVMDLDQDVWHYISYGYLKEKTVAGEVGSSTMPHKVNPINFENSEGNLQLSNALLVELSEKLTRSRMQRDLSDSTVTRNVGVAFAHAHLAITETLKGLAKIQVDSALCLSELQGLPQLLAEPIQTILRLHETDDPYTKLKAVTRGRALDAEQLNTFIDGLAVSTAVKEQLKALKVEAYMGEAPRICNEVLEWAGRTLALETTEEWNA